MAAGLEFQNSTELKRDSADGRGFSISLRREPPCCRASHSTRVRKARAGVLWTVACFLALELGLAVGMDSVLVKLRDPVYSSRASRLQEHLQTASSERAFKMV